MLRGKQTEARRYHDSSYLNMSVAQKELLFSQPTLLNGNLDSPLKAPIDKFDPKKSYWIKVNFWVSRAGKTEDVTVVESNVPNATKRWVRAYFNDMVFRPAYADGEPVRSLELEINAPLTYGRNKTWGAPDLLVGSHRSPLYEKRSVAQ